MATYNPYDAQASGGYGPPQQAASYGASITPASITQAMVEHLRGARGWIRLLSILCFMGGGFMVLAALIMLVFGGLGMALAPKAAGAAAFSPLIGLIYLPLSAIYMVPAVFMHRLANAIDTFTMQISSTTMEDVLDKNRALWKAAGITVLSIVGLTVFMMVAAFFLGIAAALMK